MYDLIEVKTAKDYSKAIQLFKEYAASINVDLSFQNFEKELSEVDKQYARPLGVLFLLVDSNEEAVGCFGIRKLSAGICELKRMYLKKEVRGKGLGSFLLKEAIKSGEDLNYSKMRLDTLPTMKSAISLYENMGFYEIEPYRFNPIEGTKYFEISLTSIIE